MSHKHIVDALKEAIKIIENADSELRAANEEARDIVTPHGGRRFDNYLARVSEYKKSNDKYKRNAGYAAPTYIVVRKGLNEEQEKTFIINENYYFMEPSMREKGFGA